MGTQVGASRSILDVVANLKSSTKYDIGLQDAEMGKVVTRFPPEASGYLHIGHAKAALLNEYFARAYQGTLIVRFDDTNPNKEKQEFEDAIKEDLELMGIKGDKVTWTSDHFEKLYAFALQMIKDGNAYVDDTPQETMREQRMHGIASKARNQSVEENLRLFDEMTKGTEHGQQCCLRGKISVDDVNKALRDPVFYRCNAAVPHNRTGTTWKVYPTYDFACPIVDSMEGVTHALRTNEYRDRNPMYSWVVRALKLREPSIWDYSRMVFQYTLLSKRKLQWFVDQKLVSGWDDPRFPTIRGIRRRGMTIDALREFILQQGPSKKVLMLEWDKFWSTNKKIIDPVAPRHTCMPEGAFKLVLSDPLDKEIKDVPKHKKNAAVGMKKVIYTKEIWIEGEDAKDLQDGEEVTLMDWGNCIIDKVHRDTSMAAALSNNGAHVLRIEAHLNLEGDFKKTKKKLTWLAATDDVVPVILQDYDYLITEKKVEEDVTVNDIVNPVTEYQTNAIADLNVASIKKGDILQFERKGYYVCDSDASPAVFIMIPDGKPSSVNLKGEAGKAAAAKEAEEKEQAAALKAAKAAKGSQPAGGDGAPL